MAKAAIRAIAEQHRAIAQRLDGDVAEMPIGIVLDVVRPLPSNAVIARNGDGKRRAPTVMSALALGVQARFVVVPHDEQVARGQTLDARRRTWRAQP